MQMRWACGFSFRTDREPSTSCSHSLAAPPQVVGDASPTHKQQSRASTRSAGPTGDMNICYVLDGVLILYGIILTALYCRLRMRPSNTVSTSYPQKQPAGGGIYAGLTSHTTDTYEIIKKEKRPIV